MTDDLTAWLLTQIAEDERIARDGMGACAHLDLCGELGEQFYETFGFEDGPARVMAECDAKRRMVKYHDSYLCDAGPGCGYRKNHHGMLRLLAWPYADRPGYREEWLP